MRQRDYRKNQPDRGRNYQTSQIQDANAPYNFIPLNDRLVPAEPIPDFDRYHRDRYTGYIELEIKALTPLYIRDTLNDKEFNEKLKNEEMRKRGEKLSPYANPDFFSPGDLPRIPGSSLRGMIRTLVEIVSFGKFENFDDRRLYYRSFADKCKRFRDEYRRHVKPNAGLLIKEGLKYYIIATNFSKIDILSAKSILSNTGLKYENFKFYNINYQGKSGYLVVSGKMDNKKFDYFIYEPADNSKTITLNHEDIDDYRRDKERRAGINLIEEVKKRGKVPCFYSEYTMPDGKRRVAFGHTLMFRIPYLKTIGDHIPQAIKVSSLDIPEAIFGNHKTHSSRVFFEDSYLVEGVYLSSEPLYPKILSSPKPTSFQHYLTQFTQNLSDFPKNLAHYNNPNPIRGYKLYWHRDPDWKADPNEVREHPTQYTQIKPIQKDAIFRGRIRFENLSKVELGALLFVIKLPDNCAHKIGMGKPYGLGSIRIKPTLFLSNRQKRYRDLFYEWDTPKETENPEEFIKEFENYILRNIGDNRIRSLWEHPRLRHLRCILDFENKPINEKTAYMDMEKKEFKNRPVLKTPEDIYNEANDNRGR